MRRTVLSSTAPTSLVCRCPSPCQQSSFSMPAAAI
jgi:hypothetical protein